MVPPRLRGLAARAIFGVRRPLAWPRRSTSLRSTTRTTSPGSRSRCAHLRAGRLAALDAGNVAEELEGLMKKERRSLGNRLEVLILHLLKWDHQPKQRSNRWRASCGGATPTHPPATAGQPGPYARDRGDLPCVYPDAVEGAAIETGLNESAFPSSLPYSVEQIFERKLPAEELPSPQSARKRRP